MNILPTGGVDRRTVLKSTAWAVPVIASAVAAPARLVSPADPPTVSARPDWVGNTRALTVESTTPGTPIPAGLYTFTTTGGVSPSAELFRTEPAMAANVTVAPSGGTMATVVLLEGHALTTFTAFLAIDGIRDTLDPAATLTVSLPTGGGASVSLIETPPVTEPEPFPVVFGPNGGHWPARTPRIADTFDAVIDVAPTWTAIAAAIATGTTQYPNGKVKIRIEPGVLPGGAGAGSSAHPVLTELGAVNRPWRILVTPRDGWGTVTGSSGYAFHDVAGVSFVGLDLTDHALLVRNSQDVAVAWSTFAFLNITANTAEVGSIEFVECVLPDQLDVVDTDRMGVRVANGYSIDGVTMSGCYVAPSYKPAGSKGHVDTLQTSHNETGWIRNLAFTDSILFQSSSQVLQFQYTVGVTLDHTALVGGRRGAGRYPFGADRHVNVGQNTVWGDNTTGVVMIDSVVLGSINSGDIAVDRVTNTVVSHLPAVAPASGSYTVDAQFADATAALPTTWFDEFSPMPDRARLSRVWAALKA